MNQTAGGKSSRFNLNTLGNFLFVVPALAMFLTFSLYPFIDVFHLSVMDWNGISLVKKFVGLGNFKDVIFYNSSWWISFKNAAVITLLALTFQNTMALMLAWFVDRNLRGGQIYRSIFFLPPILSGIVVGLMWNWIFRGEFGLLNSWLIKLGLGAYTKAWLADPKTAIYALAAVHMWKGFGWGFIILLAGLQGIPRDLYEAARVDGAGEFRVFWTMTVPLMVPVFVLVNVLTVLGTMQIYDLVITTTAGGPGFHTEVPMKRIINMISDSSRMGYACSMGLVFGAILLVVSMIQMLISKRLKAD